MKKLSQDPRDPTVTFPTPMPASWREHLHKVAEARDKSAAAVVREALKHSYPELEIRTREGRDE